MPGPALLAAVATLWLAGAPLFGGPSPSPAPSAPAQDEIQQLRDRATELTGKGRARDALPVLDRARALAVRRGDLEAQARIELLRSTAWRGLGDPKQARAAADRALALARRAGHPGVTVQALIAIGNLLDEAGDPVASANRLREAIPLAEAITDRRTLAALLERIGRNARERGDNDEALDYLGRAIAAADAAGDVALSIRARTALSTTYLGLGRFTEALVDAEQAFELARQKEPRMRPAATFALAQAHAHIWNLDRAADLWTETIERYREIGPAIGVPLALRQRMDTWFALGELERAAEDGAEALALFSRTGSSGMEAGLRARLALIAARRGDAAEARRYAESALAASRTGPERRFIDNDLGLVALRNGDLDAAARSFDDVLVRSLALGDSEYQWRARYGLGRVALERGRHDEARAHFEAAVAIIERMRRELPEASLRAAFLSDRNMAYEALITTLLDQSRDRQSSARALAVAESARSRSLADLLAESVQRSSDPRLEAVREEERRFSARLSDLQRKIVATSNAAAREALFDELRQAEADYDALVVRVRRENPAHAELVYPEPLSPEALAALPQAGEAIVAFLFDEDRGHAWIVTRGALESYAVPAAAVLEPQIRLLDALIAAGDVDGTHTLGRRLYDALLGPAREHLAGVSRMVIVPDGPLHRLSFGLLRTSADRWLFDEHALSLAPSATVLADIRKRDSAPDAEPLLAFAAPGEPGESRSIVFAPGGLPKAGLRHADAEVRDIARLLDAGDIRRDGPRRREEEIKKSTGVYRVLHFATHAVIDEVVPRRSAVLLAASGAEDGLLQMNEIPNLSLQAELVVLAACSSHVGRELGGEGLRGLSRAFMRAGSRAVLATLWQVEDAETRRLMRAFYGGLRGGLPPDLALAEAQRAMIQAGGASADPHVWAAFVVTGDAARPLFDPPPASWTWSVGATVLAAAAIGGLWAVTRFRSARRAMYPRRPTPI